MISCNPGLPRRASRDYNAALDHQPTRCEPMKADIHPDYHNVVFHDVTSDFKFLTRSTMSSKETVKWEDGEEYPLIKVEISSASHPFYTGKHKVIDTSGRIDKFQKRYAR